MILKFFKKIIFIVSKINVYLKYQKKIKEAIKWILFGKEITNFTYGLKNINELIHAANSITNLDYEKIKEIVDEIKIDNEEFRLFFTDRFFEEFTDTKFFGRRILWYIIARAMKPETIIESGVFQGLGSSLLVYALYKNSQEVNFTNNNFYGVDIKLNNLYFKNPNKEKMNIEFIEKDSLEFLRNFNHTQKILFISDAKHEYNFEIKEFNLIKKNMKTGSIIISDSGSKSLSDFSVLNKKKLVCFTEEVDKHWYPGSKCLVSYNY